jgi:Ca-activated chloride channel homolog
MKHFLSPILFFLVLILSSCETGMDSYDGMTYDQQSFDPLQAEKYNDFGENKFIEVSKEPVSTFSIDADGGSYSNIRRSISNSIEIPKQAVRAEEFINYFTFNYPEPTDGSPISVNGEVSECPWAAGHQLIRIGIKGKTISKESLPAGNLVLLIDVSGSMGSVDKLELLKKGFVSFANQMRPQDKIAIVTYAGSAGVVLESTYGSEKIKIIDAINSLGSGGSTAGAEGIKTAYKIAENNFVDGGNNRVILGTDGDFNVGPSSQEELVKLIETEREKGIFLTVLGVGEGNLNEAMMEQVADKGNGNYEYIDNEYQSQKVFINEYQKFYTVAKDVKIQIEFNSGLVEKYRLIGYENRTLKQEDFEDDKKDAGEIGSGQTITALYEIIPKSSPLSRTDPTFTIDFRYKNPDEDVSKALNLSIINEGNTFDNASEDMRFAASVAAFSMILKQSEFKGNATKGNVIDWAANSHSFDPFNYKKDFVELVKKVN